MDDRPHERAGAAVHGLVMARVRSRPRPGASAVAARLLFAVLVATILVAAVSGGLLRTGVLVPAFAHAVWLPSAGAWHAALMICGFLGTVIAIERAVAVKLAAAYVAPLASALGGVCLLLGRPVAGAWLLVLAAIVFGWVNIVVVRRQPLPHTKLLLAAGGAWLAGNLLFAAGQDSTAVLPWWFAFLVMTIAAERLEMTRLMRQRPAGPWLLLAVLAAMAGGAAWSWLSPRDGGVLYGAALVLLAWWLASYDIARRTVFADGLSRYMAVCLLGGYLWLGIGGVAWIATALGAAARDIALHAIGLGFIFSMMMGHAPVILPAVARVKLEFGWPFYVPLAALHLSLALRLGAGAIDVAQRASGATLNAASIALFAATMVGAALAWRMNHRGEGS
jgi:hypothetical protein